MSKPDFFIVGGPKCGTTALYAYLGAHPEIFMCSPKEPMFFAEDVFGDRRQISTWPAYFALFSGADDYRRAGEASTAYLRSHLAAAKIRAFNPASKIIVMLRNPVDVLYSLHSMWVYDGSKAVDNFEKALELDSCEMPCSGQSSGGSRSLRYREHVRYPQQLLRYFAEFGRENVHVIVYDDFAADPSAVYGRVIEFLGVRPDVRCRFVRINQNRRARIKLINRLLREPPAAVRSMAHRLLPLSARRLIGDGIRHMNDSTKPRPPMRTRLRKQLEQEFAPQVEELGRLLNRDLSAWYESV